MTSPHGEDKRKHLDFIQAVVTRMSAAFQAYTEWLPIRVDPATTQDGTVFHRRFTYGDLADLSVVETRQHRSEQVGSFVLIGGRPARSRITVNHADSVM